MRWWTGRAGAFPGIIRPWRLGVSLIERCRASAASGALGPCNECVEIAMLPCSAVGAAHRVRRKVGLVVFEWGDCYSICIQTTDRVHSLAFSFQI